MSAARLDASVGQTVVIGKPLDAAGTVAAEIACRTEPEDRTRFFASVGTAATNQFLYPNIVLAGDALAEVAGLFSQPNTATVAPSAPRRSLDDFIAGARARPGHLSIGSSGAGSSLHLTGALLASGTPAWTSCVCPIAVPGRC